MNDLTVGYIIFIVLGTLIARVETLIRKTSRLEGKIVIICDMLRQTNKKEDR